MKVTLFGATGKLGKECLKQCLEAGYELTVLVRDPGKLPEDLMDSITVVKGDALRFDDVLLAMPVGTNAALFAIGVDEKTSPPDLCTDVSQHILDVMRQRNVARFVWCGGGSNIVEEDKLSLGARFVRFYAQLFLQHRHSDKEHQLALLQANKDLCWIGVRPLQMKQGDRTEQYRLGFNKFSGMSKITFADCAHAMVNMLVDDRWVGKAPIIQY